MLRIHHHSHNIWGFHVYHGWQLPLWACHRIRHKQRTALCSCSSDAKQTPCCGEHDKGLKERTGEKEGERQQMPSVQSRIIRSNLLSKGIGEHEKEGAVRRNPGTDREKTPGFYDIVPSLTHTSQMEETGQRKPSQDDVMKMLRKFTPQRTIHIPGGVILLLPCSSSSSSSSSIAVTLGPQSF